ANLMAMLIQSMSAKLGIATGRSLPEVCRDRFPRPVVFFLWVQAELIAMATDLAEFVGAALGLNLLFGMPLFIAALLTGIAAFVRLAMLTSAAAVFNSRGLLGVGTDLGQVYNGLEHYLGAHSGVIFGIALLASGISSSSVGTLAGQVVMQGFIHRRISVFLRRAITMVPALIVIGIHFDPSRALVLSQVFLSFGIPFAMIPLV